MEQHSRDYHVSQIVCGFRKINVRGRKIVMKNPSKELRADAEELFMQVLAKARLNSLFSEEEVVLLLIEKGLWSTKEEEELSIVEKHIEEWKVKLFDAAFKSKERAQIRKHLNAAREYQSTLLNKRNRYLHVTDIGTARMARAKFLSGSCAYYNNRPLWGTEEGFGYDKMDWYTEELTIARQKAMLSDSEYRMLARTEPWRTIWSTKKSGSPVFGIPTCDWSDEQRILVSWSMVYDSISEHPECPDDSVIEDDDMLDGWMIKQRRAREADQVKKRGEEKLANSKNKNADEIYLPADSLEEAKKINEMNTIEAKMIKQKRARLLEKKGQVFEGEMPDIQERLNMEFVRMQSKAIKGAIK